MTDSSPEIDIDAWELEANKELLGYAYGLPDKISLYHNLKRILELITEIRRLRKELLEKSK